MRTSLPGHSRQRADRVGLGGVFAEALFGEAEENRRHQQPPDYKHEAVLERLYVIDMDAFDHGAGPVFIEDPADTGLEDHWADHVADVYGPRDSAEELSRDGLLSAKPMITEPQAKLVIAASPMKTASGNAVI